MKPENMKRIVDFVIAMGDNKIATPQNNVLHHELVMHKCPYDLGLECPELCQPIDKIPLENVRDIYLCHSCWLRSVKNEEEKQKRS